MLKSLIRFHSASKIDNFNRGGGTGEGREKKEKEKSKRIYRTSQSIRIISVFLDSLLLESFPSLNVPPHLPRIPSNIVLVSGPAVGAAQILIWSYSCVFLPPMSMAIRTSKFSFAGALSDLLYSP